MDLLPVELVRLIYQYCDPESVGALRLVSGRFADVGYEFLLPPHFTAVEWRDDVKRLRSIAGHDRLRGSIRSVTFNFSKVNEHSARHATFFEHWFEQPEHDSPSRRALLEDAWMQYYELEKLGHRLPPFHSRAAALEEAFKHLPNLKHLEITLTKSPYPTTIPLLTDVFRVPACRRRDRDQACKNMNAIVSAIRHVRLASLSIDHLPLEILRHADDRRHWFDCARSFASLSRLSLVLDPASSMLPRSRSCAVNGLGHVLQYSVNLTHLSLAFHTYHAPREKFHLSFRALFGAGVGSDADGTREFVYRKLTDLKLEGVSCAEDDLRSFLTRHAGTLTRLRLGGRGLAKPCEPSIGGVHLHEGSFRSLFGSLRGKLPKLERFHMEGDVEAGHFFTGAHAHIGGRVREAYQFRAVTDEEWMPVVHSEYQHRDGSENGSDGDGEGHAHGHGHGDGSPIAGGRRRRSSPSCVETVDCLELERYLVHGGEYPRLAAQAGA